MHLQRSFLNIRLKDARSKSIANLENLGITDDQLIRDVVPAMRSCRWEQLLLSNNRITGKGLSELAKVLAEEPYSECLRVLVLTRNEVDTNSIIQLCNIVHRCSLQVLKLDYNRLETSAVKKLLDASTRWNQLEELNLDSNSVSAECLSDFGTCLKASRLRALHLSRTSFSDECLRIVSEALHECELQRLYLSGNLITDVGIRFLALALKQSALEVLDLSQNQIVGDIKEFSRELKGSRLVKINLSGNKISEDGARNLMRGIKGSDVTELNFHWNSLSDAILNDVRSAVHFPQTDAYAIILALCSTRYRVGAKSALQRLPVELVRQLVMMLYPRDEV